MSGIFSKPKMPDTSAANKMQEENMKKQDEINKKQEERLDAQEKDAQSKLAGAARARRRGRGGYRLLLSSARANAQTGIKDSADKLGG